MPIEPCAEAPSVSADDRLALFRLVLLQRIFEDREMALYRQGRIPGSVYTGRGQEAVAAAAGYALGPDDVVAPLNRELACHFARGCGILHNEQLVARHRNALESKNLNGDRWTSALHRLAALVEQRAYAPRVHATDEVVADLERAALNEHRRDGTLARIQLRLDDGALRPLVRIRLEIENLGLQQHLIEQ